MFKKQISFRAWFLSLFWISRICSSLSVWTITVSRQDGQDRLQDRSYEQLIPRGPNGRWVVLFTIASLIFWTSTSPSFFTGPRRDWKYPHLSRLQYLNDPSIIDCRISRAFFPFQISSTDEFFRSPIGISSHPGQHTWTIPSGPTSNH